MSAHDQLFGSYIPTGSWVHSLPVWSKYLLVFAGTIPSLLARQWWLALVVLAVACAVLLASRIPPRVSLRLGRGFLVLLAVLVGYQAIIGQLLVGVTLATNLVACLLLSRVLTMTTPANDLVDALVSAARPLDRVGLSSERFGLAVALMLRSIPYLVDLFADVRTAARARGLERNWFALVTPVIVGAVAYAQRTGEALAARGLGDD
ncbi:MAG TPA: energy-coupling factor transporter transmembrane protein EcfT [Propionibacteriaceae bacterium]|nr:energy-coupling factor transporter transmembrane protein EcfT [Propionibacteriaceae bacterium]